MAFPTNHEAFLDDFRSATLALLLIGSHRRWWRMPYRALNESEQMPLCQLIWPWAEAGRNIGSPYHDMASQQIAELLWRWTVDGVDVETGSVERNVVKHDPDLLPITQAALDWINQNPSLSRSKHLTHEHTVPRKMLADQMIAQNMDINKMFELLRTFCKAVIITREEDALILPRRAMPAGWVWENGDPFARYPAHMRNTIRWP